MLKITNLQKTFNAGTVNAKTALNGLDLEIRDGEFVTVIGGNGAGKSTLLNAIAGVWKPDFGTIEIDGVDVTRMPEYKRAKFLGRVFQDPMKGTSPDMEIAENLAIASKRGEKRRFVRGVRKADREKYRQLLSSLELGLENRLSTKVGLLSVGSFMCIRHTNMRDAIAHGDRLIMMHEGNIIIDVSGEEKKRLTVEHLLSLFTQASGEGAVSDRMVLN